MKTKKMMKENCSKNFRDIWHRNKLLFVKIFNLILIFVMLTGCRRVQYGNAVVLQPLSAGSVIPAACVSVAVVHICNKVVNWKVG